MMRWKAWRMSRAHSPTLPSLYLHHSSFSNSSIASPTSQLILQPFFRFSYVTSFSLTSPGESPMTFSCVLCHLTKCRPFCKPMVTVVVVVNLVLGFMTLLTSQVISVTFYSEREKFDKFCSEALISAWGSFTCYKSKTRDPRLYFPSEGRHTQDFYALKKSINLGRVWTLGTSNEKLHAMLSLGWGKYETTNLFPFIYRMTTFCRHFSLYAVQHKTHA